MLKIGKTYLSKKSILFYMKEAIKKDILALLKQALERMKLHDFAALKTLSDKTIQNASIFQDSDSISIAVIMYSLSKLGDRSRDPVYLRKIMKLIESCTHFLQIDNITGYRNNVKSMFQLIAAYDTKFKMYIDEVIEKAQVKKGSKLHEHGISVARTAELLGIGQWELMSYIGKTRIHDEFVGRMDVKKRIEFARTLFEK
jgi:hypothetical protein